MGSHPLNLMLRFMLEMAAVGTVGIWGWKLGEDWGRFFWAALLPILLMVVWGVFAVPEDPSRSGKAPVAIPGIFRLLLELGIFAFAIWAFYDVGFPRLSLVFGFLVFLHYGSSYDRIRWLLIQKNKM